MTGPRLCIALDSTDDAEIFELVSKTEHAVDVFKIGLTAFAAHGPQLVRQVAQHRPVFLDLKLHDIPAQVEGAVRAAGAAGAAYLTIHASGGERMVEAAVGAAPDDLTILAVTVLTSLGDDDLQTLGIEGPAEKAVVRLAELATSAGAPGLVCSPQEVGALRSRLGEGTTLVVPGIRPAGSEVGDQRRTLGPAEAVAAGADILVVGRPITAAADPGEAASAIKAEMTSR